MSLEIDPSGRDNEQILPTKNNVLLRFWVVSSWVRVSQHPGVPRSKHVSDTRVDFKHVYKEGIETARRDVEEGPQADDSIDGGDGVIF